MIFTENLILRTEKPPKDVHVWTPMKPIKK